MPNAFPPEDREHILAHTDDLWEPLRRRRIFLTGGTGFVGVWLLRSLLWADEEWMLGARLTMLTRDPAAFRNRLPELGHDPRVHLLQGDVRSFSFPDGDYSFVIHAATERQQAPTPAEPTSMFEKDVLGTQRVLQFAREHRTERFLVTSSGAAYGKQPPHLTHLPENWAGAPSTEDPTAAYGHAKRTSEWLAMMCGRQWGFDVSLARLFAFLGPYLPLDLNFAAGNFLRDVLRGGPVHIGGDGTPLRSYLYAADLAIWLWTLLLRAPSGRLYNVGSPDALSIRELAEQVVANTKPDTPIHIAGTPVQGVAPSRYVPDTTRAATELGLLPLIPLDEAIRRTWNWHCP